VTDLAAKVVLAAAFRLQNREILGGRRKVRKAGRPEGREKGVDYYQIAGKDSKEVAEGSPKRLLVLRHR